MNKDREWIGAIIVLSIILAIFLIQPSYEAKTFNKFAGETKATYWDAVFTQLRIEACREKN